LTTEQDFGDLLVNNLEQRRARNDVLKKQKESVKTMLMKSSWQKHQRAISISTFMGKRLK